jgi:signal transduction histidine kinase
MQEGLTHQATRTRGDRTIGPEKSERRREILQKNTSIAVMGYGIPETIRADERKLKQILYNLLSNAVKFSQEGGEIRLSAELGTPANSNGAGLRSELKKTAENWNGRETPKRSDRRQEP